MTIPLTSTVRVDPLWEFASDTWNGLTREEIQNASWDLRRAIGNLKAQIADLKADKRALNNIICSEPVWRAMKNDQSQLSAPPRTAKEVNVMEDAAMHFSQMTTDQLISYLRTAQAGLSTALPPPPPAPEIHNSTCMEFLSREQIRLECLRLVVKLGTTLDRLPHEADLLFDWVVKDGVMKP